MGNGNSNTTSLDALSIPLTTFSRLREDEENPTYAMKISSWRCEVKKPSTVHFVAVRSQDREKSTFPPHCGLMLKNQFYLASTEENKRHIFDYLLAHAFIKRIPETKDESAPTKLVLFFCKSQEDVY